MSDQSVFAEEWRRCLRAHYVHVIRSDDQVTQKSLVRVLARLGFTEDEIRALYREATMRAEDLPDDFMPDMEQAAPVQVQPEQTFTPHPAECTCPACMDSPEAEHGHDAEGQPLDADALAEQEEAEGSGRIFPAAAADQNDEDGPRQMSMFD